ncbi:endonuclease V [Haladaptatus sp. T7]|uniref:endonuclease V n=1 Tax=Haladaptatus sp. T7 TaxID=2029368 RepID=UPI0021A25127|nr:endonuclease V [Haladaptatus sp. T7]GKZ13777.1 endonuclease V [Haladaptatus sp. T7]
MRLAHPEFAPDASLSREEMEELQHEVADAAIFEDAFEFDPESVRAEPTDDAQTHLPTGEDENEGEDDDSDVAVPTESPESPVVVGVDQAFVGDLAVSAVVASRDGEVIERAHAAVETEIPYIPGLLSFREGTAILRAFEELTVEPDLAIVDGSGRIHFREAGIATHIGVMLDLPAIGVAKNLLCGDLRDPPEGHMAEGERVPVVSNSRVSAPDGTVIGYALQSRQYPNPDKRHVNPLYVSPGHRVSAETAAELVWQLCAGYKLPEPTRRADAYADEVTETVDT